MDKNVDKMVGARLDHAHMDALASILNHYKRKFKGQLELWIEQEKRIIDSGR